MYFWFPIVFYSHDENKHICLSSISSKNMHRFIVIRTMILKLFDVCKIGEKYRIKLIESNSF